jgi:predicted aspartyl protease
MSNETRHVGIRVARAIVCCLLSIPFAAPAVAQPSAGDVQALYESRRWFELRDAIAGRRVDPLYEGAVAVAFNQTAAAERALKLALDRAATPAQANDARGLLAILYLRAGRSGDAARLLDDILAAAPDRVDVAQMRATYGAWRGRPNLRIAARRRASVPCSVDASGVRIPLIVNGQPVRWQLDTGASISVLSAAEAR